MKRKVYLEGELGHKFGREFTMNVNSFAEAIQCLDGNFSDFKKYLIDCDEKGILFDCEIAGAPVQDERELLFVLNEGDIRITPVAAGSGRGIGKLIAGIVLIYVTLQTGGAGLEYLATAGEAGSALSAVGVVLGTSIGVNLAMTGISEMLAPDPSTDNDQDESYLFQGTGQTLVEGDPVPILYGKLRVPGRPISLQVRNERLNFYDAGGTWTDSPADTNNPAPVNPPGGGGGGGRGAPAEEREHHVFR